MSTKRKGELPARLVSLRRRFEEWRGTRKVRSRIPEPLWVAAVKLAKTYGLHRTAKALRVNYYALKKRVEEEVAIGASDISASNAPKGDAATFLELGTAAPTPSISADSCECTLELEDTDGARMRVHLGGVATPDLVALSRSFWRAES
jgi:hypothetical protein